METNASDFYRKLIERKKVAPYQLRKIKNLSKVMEGKDGRLRPNTEKETV